MVLMVQIRKKIQSILDKVNQQKNSIIALNQFKIY